MPRVILRQRAPTHFSADVTVSCERAPQSAALALLRSGETFDLVITDYSMPGMNGAELGKAVRALFCRLRRCR
jgi:CheY-like chemotaxis protein